MGRSTSGAHHSGPGTSALQGGIGYSTAWLEPSPPVRRKYQLNKSTHGQEIRGEEGKERHILVVW